MWLHHLSTYPYLWISHTDFEYCMLIEPPGVATQHNMVLLYAIMITCKNFACTMCTVKISQSVSGNRPRLTNPATNIVPFKIYICKSRMNIY